MGGGGWTEEYNYAESSSAVEKYMYARYLIYFHLLHLFNPYTIALCSSYMYTGTHVIFNTFTCMECLNLSAPRARTRTQQFRENLMSKIHVTLISWRTETNHDFSICILFITSIENRFHFVLKWIIRNNSDFVKVCIRRNTHISFSEAWKTECFENSTLEMCALGV